MQTLCMLLASHIFSGIRTMGGSLSGRPSHQMFPRSRLQDLENQRIMG